MSNNNQDSLKSKVLNLEDCVEVIKEYNKRYPKPTEIDLAKKFGVGTAQIQNILFNKDAILRQRRRLTRTSVLPRRISEEITDVSRPSWDVTKIDLDEQRNREKQFLNMVMFEYLERAVFYDIPINDLTFQKKATEVKNCLGLTYFKSTFLWLNSYKLKYGLENLSQEFLNSRIVFTEEKQRSLSTFDLVQYVRTHKLALIKKDMEQMQVNEAVKNNVIMENLKKKYNIKPDADHRHKLLINSISFQRTREGNNNKRKVSFEADAKTEQEKEENIMMEEEELNITASETQSLPQQSVEVLKSLKEHFKQKEITRIIVKKRKTNKPEEIKTKKPPAEPPRIIKFFKKLKVLENKTQQSISSPLSNKDDNLKTLNGIGDQERREGEIQSSDRNPKVKIINLPNEEDVMTIKIEPQEEYASIKLEPQEEDTKFDDISIDNNQMVIKTERLFSPIDEKMKSELAEFIDEEKEFTTVNLNDTTYRLPSSGLCSPLSDTALSPLMAEETSEIPLANDISECNPQIASRTATLTNYYCHSPLPDIDTQEEALKLVQVLENYAVWNEKQEAIELLNRLTEVIKK